MTVQIRNRLNKIEASIAQMEPERPRRHLTPEESAELDELTRGAPGGDPFGHPFEKAMKWKHLHFIAQYGLAVSELRKTPMKGSLAQALQKSPVWPNESARCRSSATAVCPASDRSE